MPRRHKQRRKSRRLTSAAGSSKNVRKNGAGASATARVQGRICSANVTQLKLRAPDYSDVRPSPSAIYRAQFGTSILDGIPRSSSYRVGALCALPQRGLRPLNETGCRLPAEPSFGLPMRVNLRRGTLTMRSSRWTVPMTLNASASPSISAKVDCVDVATPNSSVVHMPYTLQAGVRHRRRRTLRHDKNCSKYLRGIRFVNASSIPPSFSGDVDIGAVVLSFRPTPNPRSAISNTSQQPCAAKQICQHGTAVPCRKVNQIFEAAATIPSGLNESLDLQSARRTIEVTAASAEEFEPPHNGTPGHYWADRAYQLKLSRATRQAAFDVVMAQPPHGREAKYQELHRRGLSRGAKITASSSFGRKTESPKAGAARGRRLSSMQLPSTFQHVFNSTVSPVRRLLHRSMSGCTEVAVVPDANFSVLVTPYTTQALVRQHRRQRRLMLRPGTSSVRWLVPSAGYTSATAQPSTSVPCSTTAATAASGLPSAVFNGSMLQGEFQTVWSTRDFWWHQRHFRRLKLASASINTSVAVETQKRTQLVCGSGVVVAPTSNRTMDFPMHQLQLADRWQRHWRRGRQHRRPSMRISTGFSVDPQPIQPSNGSANMLITPCPPALLPAAYILDAPTKNNLTLAALMIKMVPCSSSPFLYSTALTVRTHPHKATKRLRRSQNLVVTRNVHSCAKPPPHRFDLTARRGAANPDKLQRPPPSADRSLNLHFLGAGSELVEHQDVNSFFHRILATVRDRESTDSTRLSLTLTLSLLASNELHRDLFEYNYTATPAQSEPAVFLPKPMAEEKKEKGGRRKRSKRGRGRQSTALTVRPTLSAETEIEVSVVENCRDGSRRSIGTSSAVVFRLNNGPITALARKITPIERPMLGWVPPAGLLTWVSTALEVAENRPSKKSASLTTTRYAWPLASPDDESDSRSGSRQLKLEGPLTLLENVTASPEEQLVVEWKKVPALLEYVDWDEFAGIGALIQYSASTAVCLDSAL